MEAALDLAKLLNLENEPCVDSKFISIWAHSRASGEAISSNMEDFVAPQPLLVQECPASPTLTTQQHATIDGDATTETTVPHGTAIWDQATLHGGSPSPGGSLHFHLYGPNDATCTGQPIFTSTVPVEGASGPHNSGSFTPTAPGTYRWRVSYTGDANNHPYGPTACGAEPVTVTPEEAPPPPPPPPTPFHPSITTSASPASAAYGSRVGDTATLSGGYNPTGTIEFRLYGPDDAACVGPPAFVVHQAVHGNGDYPSPTPSPTIAGTYRWVAVYSGDAHNASVSTHCNDPRETLVVKAPPPVHPPIEEPEPKPKPKPRPKPKPKPTPQPPFTG